METRSIYRTPEGESEILSFYDEVLSHWPVPVQTRTIDTRHGHTFVISSGEASAPPLVLLHGAASNATSWVGQIARYAQEFRVYAVDIPGEPGRSTQNRPSWHGPGYAEWLEDVQLSGSNVGDAYLHLADEIDDALPTFDTYLWGNDACAFFRKVTDAMRVWIDATRTITHERAFVGAAR